MRCLVTGATGFVGRALVSALVNSGADVRGIARRAPVTPAPGGIPIDEIDLADLHPSSAVSHGVDVIYHLAARTHDMQEAAGTDAEYWRVNVEGTRRLLDVARDSGVRRVVFVSSVKAIDEGNERAADETTPERPSTAYGRSKLEAERIVADMPRGLGIERVCLRFPLVYGPGQRGNLERMVAAVRAGTLPPPPAGNARSMLHVENAVAALVLAGAHPAAGGRTYIVTDARPYGTREIVDAIRVVLGRPPIRWHVPLGVFRLAAWAGDLARLVAGRRVGFDSEALQKFLGSATYDARAIARELGYQPTRDLIESMPDLVGLNQDGNR